MERFVLGDRRRIAGLRAVESVSDGFADGVARLSDECAGRSLGIGNEKEGATTRALPPENLGIGE